MICDLCTSNYVQVIDKSSILMGFVSKVQKRKKKGEELL